MSKHERTRRMADQKWSFDKIIQATGVDFFWPMTDETLCTVGPDAATDIKRLRQRVKKADDISRECARVAAKREAMAKKAEGEGHFVTARDNYFTAAAFYTMAQGPIHEDDNELNLLYSARKNECYDKFIKYAPRPVERVEIPFQGKSLPALLHLPAKGAKNLPCVVHLGGMDMFKEMFNPVYGDKFLERGMAVLTFDGPGQNEARITRKIPVTEDNFVPAGRAAMDYLVGRPEIDSERIAITGVSMGSFWSLQIAAHEPRYKAASGFYVCHEPGMNTIFNLACPIFKDRYMWMAGYDDEKKFDEFAKKLSLEGLGAKIKCPTLIVAGEDDELSPIENSYRVYEEIKAPKNIVVFKGEFHGVSDNWDVKTMLADWLKDRLDGKPFESGRIYMDGANWQEAKG
jgi:dipeptidyl aminopeptidase/acylaminoacyl peptidase